MAAEQPDLIGIVELEGGMPHDQAERAARATLRTLAERISDGEARDIAEQLPASLRSELQEGNHSQRFDLGEFLHRIAEREGVTDDDARGHARAVFAALGHVVDPRELHDMASELPKDFAPLMAVAEERHAPRPSATPTHMLPPAELCDRIAVRAGLDREGARRAAEAVLEALGARLSAGQAVDIAGWIPAELRAAVERAIARKGEPPEPFTLDEFLDRVAQAEGVSRDDARFHAGAVLAVLREALPPKEYSDMLAQLPKDFASLPWVAEQRAVPRPL